MAAPTAEQTKTEATATTAARAPKQPSRLRDGAARVFSWLVDGGERQTDYSSVAGQFGGGRNRFDDMNRHQDAAHPTPRKNVLR